MRPSSPKAAIHLIGEIYDCVGREADSWQGVYMALCRMMNSGAGSIHLFCPATDTFERLADTNVPEFQQNFREVYFDLVPFKNELLSLAEGEILVRSKVFSDSRWDRSKLWREHWADLGIYHLMHQKVLQADGIEAGITFTRPKRKRDFSREDIALYQQFAPHLRRALRLHIDGMNRDSRSRVFEDAWNRSPQGMAVVEKTGRLLFANKAAHEMLKRGPLKVDRKNTLVCADGRDTDGFRSFLSNLLEATTKDAGTGKPYMIRSEDGRGHLSLLITRYVNSYGTEHAFEKLGVIVMGDPHNKDKKPDHDLIESYSLTRSESRVALLLAEGHSLKEISSLLNITPNTARTHLKRAFSKTQTSRQAELVKLILNTPRFHR